MVKKVTGVLANDGTFFEHADEAEEYEATLSLNEALSKEHIAADRFMSLVIRLWPLITRWKDARTETHVQETSIEQQIEEIDEALPRARPQRTYLIDKPVHGYTYEGVEHAFDEPAEQPINAAGQQLIDEFTERTGFDPRIKRSPEEVVEALQQLAVGGSEPVYPVGRGQRSTAVPDEGEELTPGMWGGDASGVRSS